MKIKKLFEKIYENRADIEFIGGMILTAVGVGATIRATHKNHDTIEFYKDRMTEIDMLPEDEVSEEARKTMRKETLKETVKTTAKAYAIPAGILVAGQGLEAISHRTQKGIIKGANAVIAAMAAKAVEEIKEHPLELPEEIKADMPCEIEFADDGFEVKYLFDSTNPNYSKYPGANLRFIKSMEQSWDRSFPSMDLVMPYEIIRSLGANPLVDFKEKDMYKAFIYKNEDGSVNGISFGLDHDDEATHRFLMGLENSVMLRIRVYRKA